MKTIFCILIIVLCGICFKLNYSENSKVSTMNLSPKLDIGSVSKSFNLNRISLSEGSLRYIKLNIKEHLDEAMEIASFQQNSGYIKYLGRDLFYWTSLDEVLKLYSSINSRKIYDLIPRKYLVFGHTMSGDAIIFDTKMDKVGIVFFEALEPSNLSDAIYMSDLCINDFVKILQNNTSYDKRMKGFVDASH